MGCMSQQSLNRIHAEMGTLVARFMAIFLNALWSPDLVPPALKWVRYIPTKATKGALGGHPVVKISVSIVWR